MLLDRRQTCVGIQERRVGWKIGVKSGKSASVVHLALPPKGGGRVWGLSYLQGRGREGGLWLVCSLSYLQERGRAGGLWLGSYQSKDNEGDCYAIAMRLLCDY